MLRLFLRAGFLDRAAKVAGLVEVFVEARDLAAGARDDDARRDLLTAAVGAGEAQHVLLDEPGRSYVTPHVLMDVQNPNNTIVPTPARLTITSARAISARMSSVNVIAV